MGLITREHLFLPWIDKKFKEERKKNCLHAKQDEAIFSWHGKFSVRALRIWFTRRKKNWSIARFAIDLKEGKVNFQIALSWIRQERLR